MDIDEALKEVGSWGRYQITLFILVLVCSIPNAFLSIQYVFFHYEPSHHCKFPDEFAEIVLNYTNHLEPFLDFALPNETKPSGKVVRSSCTMFSRNYSAYPVTDWTKLFNITDNVTKCDDEWVFDLEPYQKNAVSEFSLVCDDDWKPPFVVTLYMGGSLAGSFFGALADRFGRRPVFVVSSGLQVLLMVFASFVWNFASYSVAAFVCGCAGMVNYVVAFVLAAEVSDVKRRNLFAVCIAAAYAVGYCMVPLLAFFFPNWRTLLLVFAAISGGIYLPSYWLFPESAVWLIQKGRQEQGLKELKRISKVNGTEEHFNELLEIDGCKIVSENVPQAGVKEMLRVLFRSGITARYFTAIFSWFATALVYIGVVFYSTSFSEDRFLNVLYAGLAEFPALFLGFYMVQLFGRPRTVFILTLLCAVTNFTLPFVPEDSPALKTALAVLGKGAVSSVFYINYLIGSENAPTLQRSGLLAFCSSSARIASLLAPFVMYTRKIHPFLPNGIMGTTGLALAVLVLFYMPETKGVRMPDSVEEARSNSRIYGLNIYRNLAP